MKNQEIITKYKELLELANTRIAIIHNTINQKKQLGLPVGNNLKLDLEGLEVQAVCYNEFIEDLKP
jgi:hypothetical protein